MKSISICSLALLFAVACSDDAATPTVEEVPPDAPPAPVVVDAPPACVHCSALTTGTLDLANLCPASQALVLAAFSCLCGGGEPSVAKCATECGAGVCVGGAISAECGTCAATACSAETSACLADR